MRFLPFALVIVGAAIAVNIGLFAASLPTDRLIAYGLGWCGMAAFVVGILWHASRPRD